MLLWIERVINALGYPGIVALMFLENIFPPIPSEVIMPMAGFAAERGDLQFVGVVAAGMLGSVLGALPLYYLGHVVGLERLRIWADRHGGWLAVSSADIDRALEWFNRYGGFAVLLCRLVPGIRSLISIPAGVSRMPLLPFLLYTALGTGLWAAFLAYLGGLLGENYERVEAYIGPISAIVVAALLIGLALMVVRRKSQRERQSD